MSIFSLCSAGPLLLHRCCALFSIFQAAANAVSYQLGHASCNSEASIYGGGGRVAANRTACTTVCSSSMTRNLKKRGRTGVFHIEREDVRYGLYAFSLIPPVSRGFRQIFSSVQPYKKKKQRRFYVAPAKQNVLLAPEPPAHRKTPYRKNSAPVQAPAQRRRRQPLRTRWLPRGVTAAFLYSICGHK